MCSYNHNNVRFNSSSFLSIQSSINRSDAIMIFVNYYDNEDDECKIVSGEKHADYEVLRALFDQFESINGNNGEFSSRKYHAPIAWDSK
ncbi:hypothetical protein DdX_18491 [Ditylenchus destructor]|uniref:Uncharacterized protein n=1 Tax=Ditylenchus destructor TaxID=166010 RepID=A0AAD4MJU5_9BILA|nr:hypothetical protein DdX_18491 [Ditylenchus destructor]